jgi:proteic killer suppression protein
MMQVRHADRTLERLEAEIDYSRGFGRPVVRGFRKVMAWIRDADDERELYAMKSLHFEKLKGQRSHQRSLRINDQFRLIVELVRTPPQGTTVVVIGIEDHH